MNAYLCGTASRRFMSAALVASIVLPLAQHASAEMRVRTLRVDGGEAPGLIDPGPTAVVGMPSLPESSDFQLAAPRPPSELGTFNIQINPGPTLAGNAAALAAFERAAQLWESRISDPITVVVNADLAPLGPGVLGSTGSQLLSGSYSTIRNAMVSDALDEGADDAITGFLPTAANYNVTLPAGFGLNGNVFTTKANLKALGFSAASLDSIAGTSDDMQITFSSNFAFDFDKSNGIAAGQFDFEGIAAHEIGHGLGFISGVDDVDFVLPGTTNNIEPTPLDMFRFRDNVAADPATVADFANGTLAFPRNMVPQHVAMLDQILGGWETSGIEVLMSQGVDFGDGRQASHFKDSLGLGIMDPTAAPGELLVIRPNDWRAFDLIGYEIAALIPEPSSLGLLALGGVLALRRRRA